MKLTRWTAVLFLVLLVNTADAPSSETALL
jgi:hypothetical protein